MGDRVDGERDAILNANLAHQLGHVSLYGSLLDLQGLPNLSIRTSSHEKFEHFLLAIREGDSACWEDFPRGRCNAIDKDRHHAARGPDRSLMNYANRLHKLFWLGGLINVSFCPSGEGLENGLIVGSGSSNDDAQVRTRCFHAGHHVEDTAASAGAVSQEDKIYILQARQFFETRSRKFQIGLVIKKGTKSNEAQGVTVNDGNMNHRLFGSRSFHGRDYS